MASRCSTSWRPSTGRTSTARRTTASGCRPRATNRSWTGPTTRCSARAHEGPAGRDNAPARMIGARIPRNEDPRLLRGLGRFLDDINPAGIVRAAGLRSPHARARIISVDPTRARKLAGVHLVLTAADLGPLNQPAPLLIPHPSLTQPRTQRPLAAEEVRYAGELIAFVVADDRYVAEDAVDLIDVQYDPLPAVTDLEAAARPGSALVHTDVPGNRAAHL